MNLERRQVGECEKEKEIQVKVLHVQLYILWGHFETCKENQIKLILIMYLI